MLSTLAAACCAVAVLAQAPQTPAPAPQQPSEIQLVISGEPGTPPRYAVPDFVALSPDVADVAKMLGQVLWDDLNFEREFYMIPRDTYSTIPVARTAEEVPFNAWRELGADAVVFGTVQKTDANTVRVQVRYSVQGTCRHTGTWTVVQTGLHTILQSFTTRHSSRGTHT